MSNMTELRELVSQADLFLDMLKNTIDDYCEGAGITCGETKDNIRKLNDADFDERTMEELFTIVTEDELSTIKEQFVSVNDQTFDDYYKETLKHIRDDMVKYDESVYEKNKLVKEYEAMVQKERDYFNSEEYRQTKLKTIEDLQKAYDETTDPSEKFHLKEKIAFLENIEDMRFILKCFEENPDIEAKKIKERFFNNNRSDYIHERFLKKIKKFKIPKDVTKAFYNIEEKYLPEEYHVYNNLFLFHIMSVISYSDPYNKKDSGFVSTIIVRLHNLVFNDNPYYTGLTINIIKEFLDHFESHRDDFETYNISHPKHPERLARIANMNNNQ